MASPSKRSKGKSEDEGEGKAAPAVQGSSSQAHEELEARSVQERAATDGSSNLGLIIRCTNQRKAKGQQLKGKIVSALFTPFGTFSHMFTFFFSSEFFRTFPPGLFPKIKGFYYCFSSKRIKANTVPTKSTTPQMSEPQPPLLLKKVSQCTSNLYCNTPPICIAVLSVPLHSEEREILSVLHPFASQYASHLYCSTPPIRIAALLRSLGGCGHKARFRLRKLACYLRTL